MGLKKYEIITVGSDKRVRALRSWQVGDRYVNIGDVGGIVYDEKTLSQDGACWLFRGNFGFPGARIGGDSIVDVGEAALPVKGSPAVDILGSSVVVGSKILFESEQTAADAVVLGAADFEQGSFASHTVGTKPGTANSTNYIRSAKPIFLGGRPLAVSMTVPGYRVLALTADRDGNIITATSETATGAGVTLTIPAGQWAYLRVTKGDPYGATTPADATAAEITFTGTYETKLSIVDSHVEINPATSAGTTTIRPGGTYTMTSGAKYPEAIIRNSKVSLNVPASTNRTFRFMGQIIGSGANIDATARDVSVAGQYSNIKNLTASGVLSTSVHNIIQATNCDNFAVSTTIFPGLAAAQTANMPFIFQGCNVPNGLFYHHAQIANTYKNIDFAKAQDDLGKATASGGVILVSSEVEGMYRAAHKDTGAFGALVESYESVKSLSVLNNNPSSSYGTTIYKDAYLNGLFQLEGTNVFGNKVRSRVLAQVLNVQPRAVQGMLNTTVVGETITGVVANANRVCVPVPFRINSGAGLSVNNVPAGIEVVMFITTQGNVILAPINSASVPTARLTDPQVYLVFLKTVLGPITPEDLAGVTVTVYNGCKIVNTGATAVNMKGNIRVEGNATLTNCSITGSGYFGGKAVASGLLIEGSVFMSDNASFTKTAGAGAIGNLKMKDNGIVVLGDTHGLGVLSVSENARLQPTNLFLSDADLIMSGNAVVTSGMNISGVLVLKDDARITTGSVTVRGDITLCGSYNQTTSKTWTGKRVIDSVDAPTYDDNVKTQYDF